MKRISDRSSLHLLCLSVERGKYAFLACAILACRSITVSDFVCILACFLTWFVFDSRCKQSRLHCKQLCEVPVRINSPYTPFLYEVHCPGL